MKKKSRISIFSNVWVPLLYIVGLMIYVALNIERPFNLINTIVAAVFFFIIAIIFIRALVFLHKGRKIVRDLENATDRLNDMRGMTSRERKEIFIRNNGLLTMPVLVDAFQTYAETEKTVGQMYPGNSVDISEYISRDVLDREIHVHFLNQVTGAMTGLGILGTFVGLSIGLNGFVLDASTPEAIAQNLEPLMEGIKVAFHTSIVGLVYSLGFNMFHRAKLVLFYSAVDDYLDAFGKNIVPLNETGSNGPVLRNQREMIQYQRDALDVQLFVRDHLGDFTKSFSSEITNSLVPEMHEVCEAIRQSASQRAEEQTEAMEKMASVFLNEMRTVMGESFEELRSSIMDTAQWQKKTLVESERILSSIGSMAVDMGRINTQLSDTVEKTANAVQIFSESQGIMAAALNGMSSSVEGINRQSELSKNLLVMSQEVVTKAEESQRMYNEQLQNQAGQIESSLQGIDTVTKELMERLSSLKDASERFEMNVSGATEKLGTASMELSENMNKRTAETFRVFDQEVGKVLVDMGDALDRIDEEVSKASMVVTGAYSDLSERVDHIEKLVETKN